MPTLDEIRAGTFGAGSLGIAKNIEDRSGILAQMTKKQANGTLRYAMQLALLAWHKKFAKSRFGSKITLENS